MKYLLLMILLVSSLYAGNLHVTIDDVIVDSGTVYIGIFDKDEKFTLKGKEVKSANVPASKSKLSGTFKNLPLGSSYAVYAFQDMNGNGILDEDKMGKPTEPYGFSNQTKKGFQNYLRSAFIMKDSVSIEIMLRFQ